VFGRSAVSGSPGGFRPHECEVIVIARYSRNAALFLSLVFFNAPLAFAATNTSSTINLSVAAGAMADDTQPRAHRTVTITNVDMPSSRYALNFECVAGTLPLAARDSPDTSLQATRTYKISFRTHGRNWQCQVTAANWYPARILVDGDQLILLGLAVPAGHYALVATKGYLPVSWVKKEFGALQGATTSLSLADLGLLSQLAERLPSREAGEISFIFLLITAWLAASRKRLEDMLGKLLDRLTENGINLFRRRRFLSEYNRDLASRHRYLPLVGHNAVGIGKPPLDEVFISLRVMGQRTLLSTDADDTTKLSIPFQDAVRRHERLVVLGGPGTGKSTALSYAALQLARGNGRKAFGFQRAYLPIFVPLRRLPNTPTTLLDDILNVATQIIPPGVRKRYPDGFLDKLLKRGGCAVLLDGLDEVQDIDTYRTVADKVNTFVAEYPDNRFVVTCRVASWQNLLPSFDVLSTCELSREEIHRFVIGWHTAVVKQDFRERAAEELRDRQMDVSDEAVTSALSEASEAVDNEIDTRARGLIAELESSGGMLAVATNPMLLSLMCLIHLQGHGLPTGRAVLYGQCVDLLLQSDARRGVARQAPPLTETQREIVLRRLAYTMQSVGKAELQREQVTAHAEAVLKEYNLSTDAANVVRWIEERTGILVERTIDVLGFSHLTFQEYLAAKHIKTNQELTASMFSNIDTPEWREVILLYAALVDDATPLIMRLAEGARKTRLILAARCVGEAAKCDQGLVGRIVADLLELLTEHEDVDVLVALAAIASDWSGEPRRAEEKLGAAIVNRIEHGDMAAAFVAGEARLQRALDPLINGFRTVDAAKRTAVAKSIVSFGNLAVPYVEAAVREGRLTPDAMRDLLRTLAAINTGNAARCVIELYDHCLLPADHIAVSMTIAKMLVNPLIAADVCGWTNELGVRRVAGAVADKKGCPWPSPVTQDFLRLEQVMREDLQAAIAAGCFDDALARCSFRVLFAALVAFIAAGGVIDASRLVTLGFATAAVSPVEVWSIMRNLRKAAYSIKTALGRSDAVTTRSGRSEAVATLGKIVCNGYFTLYVGLTGLLLLVIYSATLTGVPWSSRREWITLAAVALPIVAYLLTCYLVWQRRGGTVLSTVTLDVVFFTTAGTLRALPGLLPLGIWPNFGAFAVFASIFSPGSILLGISAVQDEPFMWKPDYLYWFVPTLLLVLLAASYYKYVVLDRDAVRRLLDLHPEGQTL